MRCKQFRSQRFFISICTTKYHCISDHRFSFLKLHINAYTILQMLEHGLDEVRAEELKGRVLQYMTDTVLPSLVAEEDATAKEPAVSAEDDNLFDLFGSALLEGCADLDLDKVCRNVLSLNYGIM